MRNFIIVGHKATTTPNFSLEDIPGTSGRLDILCRAVTAAFVLSHGIRKDVCVHLILLGGEIPKTIRLVGETLRHLNPDERTTAALLKKALALPAAAEWAMSTSGIFVRTGGLAEVLADLKDAKLIYLREDGADIRSLDAGGLSGDAAFILGDHTGMTPEEESLIEQAGARVVSLGSTSLHADHCVVLLNWLLDTNVLMQG
ncbi:MAG: tRNA (pseudouridine(54)-N(1))-methyltransferase TrmY [Methanothrix sp.]|jgi:tRNA (pseudouridine54-N1)-methyltransferase|nr:tRNA (pseudouridine(54)-N(1))-methyltransferase TrmY [Methanothrix sp.]